MEAGGKIVFRCIVFVMFLGLAAWQDLRRMEIDLWIFGVFGVVAVVLCIDSLILGGEPSWKECLGGGLFGGGFLLISRVSGGRIGAGDGLFFVVAGLLLGLEKCILLFVGATFLCGIYSLFFYTCKRLRHNLQAGKQLIPFLPFVAMTGVLMIWSGLL
jgi:leader peptidase (prepilin peptidase)/N-methyltransferase